MGKYIKEYSGIPSEKAKREAALQDIRDYLPEKNWDLLMESYKMRDTDTGVFDISKLEIRQGIRKGVRTICGLLLGIEGYPVQALETHIMLKHIERARNHV